MTDTRLPEANGFLSLHYNTKIIELKPKPVASFLLGMATLVYKIPLKMWFSLLFLSLFSPEVLAVEYGRRSNVFSKSGRQIYCSCGLLYLSLNCREKMADSCF